MTQLPQAHQLATYLGRLLRRDVEAKLLSKPAPGKLAYAGTFHGGERTVIAMCAADLRMAAYTGAALSMIPPDAAQEQVATGALDETLSENFAEVLNVLARVYVVPESRRVTLLQSIFPPAAAPASIDGVPAGQVKRADFEVTLDGYGTGLLTLWAVAA